MCDKWITPPKLAKLLGVNSNKVRGWIESGELRAVNLGNATRPRWRISQDELDAFVLRRTSGPKPESISRRRRRVPSGSVIQFFR